MIEGRLFDLEIPRRASFGMMGFDYEIPRPTFSFGLRLSFGMTAPHFQFLQNNVNWISNTQQV